TALPIWARNIGAPALVATLLNLAQRGYVEIREMAETRRGFFGEHQHVDYQFHRTAKPLDVAEPFERHLLEFLLEQSQSATTFTMSALKKAASRRAFHKWFSTWAKQVKSKGEATTFFEPYAAGALGFHVLTGLAIMVTGIVFCVRSRSPAGLPSIVG